MVDLSGSSSAAQDLRNELSVRNAWVVVFGDRALAEAFDRKAGGVRGVILVPSLASASAVLTGLAAGTQAAAISVGTGTVVDVVTAGEAVDTLRIFAAFARAETQ